MLLASLRKIDLPRVDDLGSAMAYHMTLLFVLISIPILSVFPLWVTGCVVAATALKVWSLRGRFVISRWLIIAAMISVIVVLAMNILVFGKEYTAIALLLMLAALKLLEAKGQRDAFLLMLIYFLLVMGGVMVSDSPLVFGYLFICLLYNFFIQLRISQPATIPVSLKRQLKSLVTITVLALPFVVVLFFFFPRIEPLWKQPHPPRSQTGLSDSMSPDGLSELAQSGELAFRVKFDNSSNIPRNGLLYWRGPVLVDFDGTTWTRLKKPPQVQPLGEKTKLFIDRKTKVDYTIYHTGATDTWLLPLDFPQIRNSNTTVSFGVEVQSSEDIVKATAFDLSSYTVYELRGLAGTERTLYTDLPDDLYPKARELAATLKKNTSSDQDFIGAVLRYFNENPYYYDLAPSFGNDDIDTFLFDNQAGYCEHYASATAFMLRSVGIPARVIIGYQGGEFNEISQELEVKQLNAHAWVEAYVDNKRWMRVDPTSAVALERITSGSPLGNARNSDLIDLSSRWEHSYASYKWLSSSVRALSSFWQNWVINYSRDKQRSLWQRFGLDTLSAVGWIFLAFIAIPIAVIIRYYYKIYRLRNAGDDIEQAMKSFMRSMRSLGVPHSASTPLFTCIQSDDARQRLGASFDSAERVVQLYYHLRYGNEALDVKLLTRAVASFKKQAQRKSKRS